MENDEEEALLRARAELLRVLQTRTTAELKTQFKGIGESFSFIAEQLTFRLSEVFAALSAVVSDVMVSFKDVCHSLAEYERAKRTIGNHLPPPTQVDAETIDADSAQ